ncbi:hypothetical protein HanPSC8_Chr05g0189811 [Helianthus annuus]|nr:hypothetical protein HanPSC8_Chr05g0189811 [Helianthus annuus]
MKTQVSGLQPTKLSSFLQLSGMPITFHGDLGVSLLSVTEMVDGGDCGEDEGRIEKESGWGLW